MDCQLRMTREQLCKIAERLPDGAVIAVCGQRSSDTDYRAMIYDIVGGLDGLERAALMSVRKNLALLLVQETNTDIPESVDKVASSQGISLILLALNGETVDSCCVKKGPDQFPVTVAVAGNHIQFFWAEQDDTAIPDFAERHAQCLGEATTRLLRKLKVGVVGVSGTGSIVVEQLVRLGVGKIVLIEPEKIETRNLNRILNSTINDVGRLKTDVAGKAIGRIGLDSEVTTISSNLASRKAVAAISGCDILFGCVDSAEGRYLLNRIAAFYIIPYFDVGLRLKADGKGGIEEIFGSVHVLIPGGSSLLSRGAITDEQIRRDAEVRKNPNASDEDLRQAYIKGVRVDSPAVISFNMFYSSLLVIEFLNRMHGFREDAGNEGNWICVSLTEDKILQMAMPCKEAPCPSLTRYLGRGDMEPPLDRSELTKEGMDL